MKDSDRVHAQKAGRSLVAARPGRGTTQAACPGQRSRARRALSARAALETGTRSAQADRAVRGGGAQVDIVKADKHTNRVRNASSNNANVNKHANIDVGDRATSEKKDNR